MEQEATSSPAQTQTPKRRKINNNATNTKPERGFAHHKAQTYRRRAIPATDPLGTMRKRTIWRDEAAASSDGQPVFGEIEAEKPKVLSIEVDTLKKIIPLGIMFFCSLFNHTILRDTKDVLDVSNC